MFKFLPNKFLFVCGKAALFTLGEFKGLKDPIPPLSEVQVHREPHVEAQELKVFSLYNRQTEG